jgi:hypothetical protein
MRVRQRCIQLREYNKTTWTDRCLENKSDNFLTLLAKGEEDCEPRIALVRFLSTIAADNLLYVDRKDTTFYVYYRG